MKIYIDFSVFTEETGAYGNVTGELDLGVTPQVGDKISFMFSSKQNVPLMPEGFSGVLSVTDRILSVSRENQQLSLSLSDLTMPTLAGACELMSYFEEAFGLFVDVYEEMK